MSDVGKSNHHPLVTVLVMTRPPGAYLQAGLSSVLEQTYRKLQIIVTGGDGATRGVVRSFNDSRIILMDGAPGSNPPRALNHALQYAEGRYIAYLHDENVYYPNHVETLVDLLENSGDCGVSYADFYTTHCRILPNGERQVLGKVLAGPRDFDRWALMHSNYIPHDSLIHTAEMLTRAGKYNEALQETYDWDLVRRMGLCSDFAHSSAITGELFAPIDHPEESEHCERADNDDRAGELLGVRVARSLMHVPGETDRALELARELNETRPTVDSLLAEATLHRRGDRIEQAVDLLERAERILQRKG